MNCRNLFANFVLPAFLLLFANSASAQTKTISGRVTDAAGTGLAGVTVAAKGQSTVTSTNSTGEYRITVPEATTTLVFSSIGYGTREAAISGNSVDITLQLSDETLNEVVVIGYGTARKKDLTGSVSTVSAADFVKGPITTAEQLIAGKVSGVQITSNSGQPGAGSRIRIRGGTSLNASNDPLIVIDGVPIENGGVSGSASVLSTINPNDIESFNILKDASAAAIYGSRAANGVILITTKKGTSGKLKIGFSSLNSVSKRTGEVDVLSADQFRAYVNANGSASDKAALGTANTNWQDEIYRTGFSSDNNISFSGGVAGLPYRLSLGYLNENGILKRSNLNRRSATLSLTPRFLGDHLGVTANAKYSHTNNFYANQGAIGSAVYFDPTKPIHSGKSNLYGGFTEWTANNSLIGIAPRNPVGLLESRDDESDVNRFLGNLQLDYKFHFLPDLRANLNLGMDKSHGEGTIFVPAWAASDSVRGGVNNQYEQDRINKLLEFYLNYAKDITSIRSRIDLMGGYSWQDWLQQTPEFLDRSANGTLVARLLPDEQQNTLISFYGRLNYSLADKYLFTFTMRRDGSSRFSPDNRWGNFPSAAVAWNIKEESFLRSNNAISTLKLRLGWGVTGQQEGIQNYGYQSNIFYGDSAAMYPFGGQYYIVARPQAYDANLKWEETETKNIGLDLGFAGNRINLTADYYTKDTRDLLAAVPAPAGTNFSNVITTNIGSITNKGLEFGVDVNAVNSNDFNLDLGYNLTYILENEITRLQLVKDPDFLGIAVGNAGFNNRVQIHSVGYRPYTFFLYKQVYDKDGAPIEGLYEDKNRDGNIDDRDKYWVMNPEADVFMGFSANATMKKFGAGFSMRASFGNYMYNHVKAGSAMGVNILTGQNYLGNAHSDILTTGFQQRQTWSDYYLENASFLRMDNAYLTYNFGKVMNDKANLRLSANIQNVFVITEYTGLDPEVNGGIDGGIYPRPRMFALGINLDF